MCIIYHAGDTTMIIDLGEEKEGRCVCFSDGYAWFTYEGEAMKLPVEDIEQIIC